MKKILFILKERVYSPSKISYGLINSANHVARFLERRGYNCKVVTVLDSNFIDKEVYEFNPDLVIIEALWVPTYKLKELIAIHRYKDIKWVVRVHSDIGFLSCETQALKFLNEYIDLNNSSLTIALNNKKFADSLSETLNYKFTYLPNVITLLRPTQDKIKERDYINIGCFGATRLLKNQCFQAMCAIKAANILNKKLLFHISPNLDQDTDPILSNLKQLFRGEKHDLIIHDWMPNRQFQKLVKKMDLGLQVSYTESFNIVAADFINNSRVVIGSDAIDWLPEILKVSTIDYDEVTRRIVFAYDNRNSAGLKYLAERRLLKYNIGAKKEWGEFLHFDYHGKDKN